MPLSARNHLKGEITEVILGTVTALITLSAASRSSPRYRRGSNSSRAQPRGPCRISETDNPRHRRQGRSSRVCRRADCADPGEGRAPLGKDLKGPNMAVGLVASAPDGYRVLFSIAEFDTAFSDRVILLADRRDGKPLDSREGPLRIVVPGDKRHARWIRGVTTLEVLKVR